MTKVIDILELGGQVFVKMDQTSQADQFTIGALRSLLRSFSVKYTNELNVYTIPFIQLLPDGTLLLGIRVVGRDPVFYKITNPNENLFIEVNKMLSSETTLSEWIEKQENKTVEDFNKLEAIIDDTE